MPYRQAYAPGNLEIIAALSDLGKELSLGEIDQICNARDHHFDEPSLHIHDQKKTASLFMNCAKMGAEAAGASAEEYAPLVSYAEAPRAMFPDKG